VSLVVPLPEHNTSLQPTWAVRELGDGAGEWQLLVRVEDAGVDPDQRASLDGWEATPQQRFERLLRETGVFVGLMITDNALRLTYAPRGETSGHLTFPIRPLATVAGRPMLGGLKLLLGAVRLFIEGDDRRLPVLLSKSRDAQAAVSTALAGQVLGALHELLRDFDAAEPDLVRHLATTQPGHLYEGLLTVLMRLVFVLYAEDRDLLPSRTEADARRVYETSYAVRGLYARLSEDAALHPDTMDERQGGWGQLLALFRLIYGGHRTHFVQARGGKLFDPETFPLLEGRALPPDAPRVPGVSDGCLLRILEGLMTLKLRGGTRERLSYRALDVEQIGSVYETVMGFEAGLTSGRSLAIKAGKNNKTPVFVDLDALAALKGKARIKSLKEDAGRALTAAQAKPIEDAESVEDLVVALDSMVDERGSPKKSLAAPGTPILQPTDERRRTGSHYTPRSLTAPIVKYALEPAFARLGPDATADQVLDLKVCDPAMGSGAFLVEACRALGERLILAWARWPESRPTIPADEDEELHARRLVAQRCLYGVDKNPRAVDLARLSLWLATLARDHEFSFLDHALKSGDSLVGLTPAQIAAANWDEAKPGLPLFRQLVRDRVAEAERARAEIQSAPDDTARVIQEQRHRHVETRLSPIRVMGDAVLSAFFAADKAKAREKARAEVETVEDCVTETQTGFQRRRPEALIDPAELAGGLAVAIANFTMRLIGIVRRSLPSNSLMSFSSSSSVGRRSRSLLLPTRPRRLSAIRARSTGSMDAESPCTAAACESTSLMAPISMLTVTGPAPSAARARPNLMSRSRSKSTRGFFPSSRFSITRVADFDRPGALPTSFMSAMCRSIRSPNVLRRAILEGCGVAPRSISRSLSVAHCLASSRRRNVSLM